MHSLVRFEGALELGESILQPSRDGVALVVPMEQR